MSPDYNPLFVPHLSTLMAGILDEAASRDGVHTGIYKTGGGDYFIAATCCRDQPVATILIADKLLEKPDPTSVWRWFYARNHSSSLIDRLNAQTVLGCHQLLNLHGSLLYVFRLSLVFTVKLEDSQLRGFIEAGIREFDEGMGFLDEHLGQPK